MEATINQVQEIVSVLTSDEQQLLKDTINYGFWGDSDWEFLDDNGNVVLFNKCIDGFTISDIQFVDIGKVKLPIFIVVFCG